MEMLEAILQNINVATILVLFTLGYIAGTIAEKVHYKSIKQREKDLLNLPAITSKELVDREKIKNAALVDGSVVISQDYFKRFLASLRNIFGGEIASYETLLDRGRREAILRMKEEAKKLGATMIINMRVETSSIGMRAKGSIGSIEVYAYGTAVEIHP